MDYCVREDALDLSRHEIIGGPWDAACVSCGSSSSSTSSASSGSSASSASSGSSLSCCPQSLWSGAGKLDLTGACPNTSPDVVYTYDPLTGSWSTTKLLGDGVHSITAVIACDPGKTGCERWSASASTDCPDGSITVGSILVPCEQTPEPNGPPHWQLTFNPGSCGCPPGSSSSSAGPIDVSMGFTVIGLNALRTNESPDGCSEANPTWYGNCPESGPYCPFSNGYGFIEFYQTIFDFYYVDPENAANSTLPGPGWYFRVFGYEYAYNPGGGPSFASFPTSGWVTFSRPWYTNGGSNGDPVALSFSPYICAVS